MSGRAPFGSSKRGGLKQASRIWHEKLKADMEELGFVQCQQDHAVFCHGEWGSPDWAVCAFWVDDEMGVGSCQQLDRVASMFNQKYGISGKGEMRWTLRIGVAHDRDTHIISLSQEEYINNLFRPQDANTVTTLLEPGMILTKEQCPTTPAEPQGMSVNRYRELIGSLQYVTLTTRPDISFPISKLAQFLVNPAQIHLDAALCVLRYLKGTRRWTLNLRGDIADIAGYTDSDSVWGGD